MLKFTKTTKVLGGRGSYFLNLVTETILRHIQFSLSTVLKKYLDTAVNYQTDPEEKVLFELFQENKHFSSHWFYKHSANYNARTNTVTIEDIPEVSSEVSPWDWCQSYFEDTSIFEADFSNLMTESWFKQAWEYHKATSDESGAKFSTAWKEGKLTKHAPSRIAHFIRSGIKPQAKTCYLLLAVYREIGFEIPLVGSEKFVHDYIGTRLEAFCRLYIGTVLQKFYVYEDTTKKYKYRDQILRTLADSQTGLIFHKGNHFASRFSRKDDTTQDSKPSGFEIPIPISYKFIFTLYL